MASRRSHWQPKRPAGVAVRRNPFVRADYRFSNYEALDSFDKHRGVIGIGLPF